MTVSVRGMAVVAVAAVVLISGVLLSCSGSAAGQINYAVDTRISTYNTTTVAGATSSGPQAFARVLTGFTFHGPEGQVLPDHDFGSVSVVGTSPLVLDYQIADAAVYSDGYPVTCDDMVLAWLAQSGRFSEFDAASTAGYRDIAEIDCRSGEKKARVTYFPDRSIVDYDQLFTATSIMPSHVIGDELGLKVVEALSSGDRYVIARIAQAWNTLWDLAPGVDVKRFPSSGPYRLDSVLSGGAVVLVANERWWGAQPATERITVWPRGVDVQDRLDNGTFQVVDVAAGSSGTLISPDDYELTTIAASGVEQLIFSVRGSMTVPALRQALALCTPRDAIARNAAVPIANSRLNAASDDAFSAAEAAVAPDQFSTADPNAARAALGGQPLTVRMGYEVPNPRLAAVVGAIATSCAAAGITVRDVASEVGGPEALGAGVIDVLVASTGGAVGSGSTGSSVFDAYDVHTGNRLSGYSNPEVDGIIAALATTSDPKQRVRLLRDGAQILWADMPTLPLYRQQRMMVASKNIFALEANPTRWGAGWNMDRWLVMQ